ncbi:MAG: hypothetical protein Q8N52_04960, partial [Acidobacteriota bacterium]|nr:hypothetical protein [Acidobacteriota bacterium]
MSLELQSLVRAAYGILMLMTLLAALPHWRRYFLGERWGGYTESGAITDAVQNPLVMPVVLTIWL